jgi:hypothetical protein
MLTKRNRRSHWFPTTPGEEQHPDHSVRTELSPLLANLVEAYHGIGKLGFIAFAEFAALLH